MTIPTDWRSTPAVSCFVTCNTQKVFRLTTRLFVWLFNYHSTALFSGRHLPHLLVCVNGPTPRYIIALPCYETAVPEVYISQCLSLRRNMIVRAFSTRSYLVGILYCGSTVRAVETRAKCQCLWFVKGAIRSPILANIWLGDWMEWKSRARKNSIEFI